MHVVPFFQLSLKKKVSFDLLPPPPLTPQRLSLGIPLRIKKIRNSECAWYDGKRERAGAPLPFFPCPIVPRAFLIFPSPQPPNDTKRPMRMREPFDTSVSRRFSHFQLVMSLQKCARMV